MKSFLERHRESISATLSTFDRVIFKGHLNGLFPLGAFARYPWRRNVPLTVAGLLFAAETRRIGDPIAAVAAAAGRPVEELAGAGGLRSGVSKEARARQIAERDGVAGGLVCVLSAVAPCRSFTVVANRQTRRLEGVHRPRRWLHSYPSAIDREFGWMPVRIRAWAPSGVQVYVDGRARLARRMDRAGIGYRRRDNATTRSRRSATRPRPATRVGGSPPPMGRRSSIVGRRWSIPCPRHHRRPVARLLVGDRPIRGRRATSCSPAVRRWRPSGVIW